MVEKSQKMLGEKASFWTYMRQWSDGRLTQEWKENARIELIDSALELALAAENVEK